MKKLTAIKRIVLIIVFFLIFYTGSAQDMLFNILNYGAKGDGFTLNTKSIQSAIDACSEAGGGTVYFPNGNYLSGTIYLKSHITLFINSGAFLTGSKDLKDYPVTITKTRSYTDNYTNKSLIYAEELENISIIGKGTIDGNGASFKVDVMDNDDGLRSTDDFAYYKSRPFLIRMINCKGILVRDITLMNSPMWVQHYLTCEDVNIDGIKVNSRVNDNNDGIDVDACNRVRISNCDISSSDDAIVLKSTLNKPCKNITITNCLISSNQYAFKIGTETSGNFQNISLSNCEIYNTHQAGIALEMVDGGSLNNVSVSNINMDSVGCAIFVRLGNRARPFMKNMAKPGMGSMSNIIINNIQATNVGNVGCSINGLPSFPVRNLTLSNIRINFKGGGRKDLVNKQIEEFPAVYPDYFMFGMLPAYGFYCRHAENIKFNNVDLFFNKPDDRPAIVCDDIKLLELQSINASTMGTSALFELNNVSNSLIQSCVAPKKLNTFIQVNGLESKQISIIGNDLSEVKNCVLADDKSSVFINYNRLK